MRKEDEDFWDKVYREQIKSIKVKMNDDLNSANYARKINKLLTDIENLNRQTITPDDCLNVKIDLETSKTVNEFLDKLF